MAQGFGAKAKKVFNDMKKKRNEDGNYKDSFSSEIETLPIDHSATDDVDIQKMLEMMMLNPDSALNNVPDEEIPSGRQDMEKFTGAFKNQMFAMTKDLYSKENIHPFLRDGADAYTKWLLENASNPTISTKDKMRHQEVCAMYHEMVDIFNKQKDTDSPDIQYQNSAAVYSLLIDTTQLGPLPEPVVQAMGEFGTGLTSTGPLSNQPVENSCVVS